MELKRSFVLMAACSTMGLANAQTHPIIAADPTDDHPAVVGLGIDFGERRYVACTGTLITPRLVLTAAHCDSGLDLDVIVDTAQAYFGRSEDDIDEVIGFSDGWIHPDNAGLDFDLGLVALDRDASASPTSIWTHSIDDEFVDSSVTAVGWGQAKNDPDSGGIKRSASLTINRVSEMFLISFEESNPNNALPCDGDSGGPLYRYETGRWLQVGVHSWGEDPCADRSGSTRIDVGREWIEDVINEVHGSDDICEINDRYGDGVCDRNCPEEDSDCDKATACGCAIATPTSLSIWLCIPVLWARRRGAS